MKIHGRQNQIRKKNKMTEKKAKKTLKVRDLKPTKDARGGYRHRGHACLRVAPAERTRGPPHAVALAFTGAYKGITVTKVAPWFDSRGAIFIYRRPLPPALCFEGMHEIDLRRLFW